jgi:HEPN domain-containing protein
MREDLRDLLAAAADDLDTAEKLHELGKHRYTCFFAHQAVEKHIKAYLLHRTNKYPFTHSIAKLIREAMTYDRDFEYLSEIKADRLEDYYTGVRYPPLIVIGVKEAKEALEIAKKVRDFVLKKLGVIG